MFSNSWQAWAMAGKPAINFDTVTVVVVDVQALEYGGYPEAELQKLVEDQCNGNMQQRRDHAQQLLAATQAVLDKQAAAWNAACAAVGLLLTQLSEAHDRHKEGHATLQSGIKKALEMTKQVRLKSLMGSCV